MSSSLGGGCCLSSLFRALSSSTGSAAFSLCFVASASGRYSCVLCILFGVLLLFVTLAFAWMYFVKRYGTLALACWLLFEEEISCSHV
jgi:hypothetical protein